jgi:hypothetical protein
MEGPRPDGEGRDRTWSIAIASFLAAIFTITLISLTFFTVVAEPQFVVGDQLDYEISGSANGTVTLVITNVNATDFTVSGPNGTIDLWTERLIFWYDGVDNATLESSLVDTERMDTKVGTRMVDHHRYVSVDGAVEDVFIGADNGVIYEIDYSLADYELKIELVGSNVGWI